jgi:hypothetical protein
MMNEIEDQSPVEEIARVERQYTSRRISAADQGTLSLGGLYTKVRRIVLQPSVPGSEQQYASVPIGTIDGVSLIVAWPSDADGLLPLKQYQEVKVKFFYELNLMMFNSSIQSLVFQPRPHIHLEWPREVSSVEVRDVSRIRVDRPSSFNPTPSDDMHTPMPVIGKILDISHQGAGFFCEQDKLSIGEEGSLLIAIWPDKDQPPIPFRAKAIVAARNEIKRMSPPGWMYGLEFPSLTSQERLFIWALMGETLEMRREG